MQYDLLLFDTDLGGHRHGYMEYLAGEFPIPVPKKLIGKNLNNWLQLVKSPQVILVSADYYVIFAGTVGFVRRLLGKRSSAIYIAAHNLNAKKGVVASIKGTLLRLARTFKILNGYAITPFDVLPDLLPPLCTGWIYDIQFCASNSIASSQPLESETFLQTWFNEQNATSGKTIVQLGYLWQSRGAGQLLKIGTGLASDSGWSVLLAGKMDDEIRSLGSKVGRGNILIHDSFLSEEMFDECLKKADLIWCYFPPEYDQSSGVFCNAFTSGKPVVVRGGSILERFGLTHLAMETVPPDPVLRLPLDAIILQGPHDPLATLAKIRNTNHQTLQGALRE
jgi:hypothetical protein